MSRDLRVDSEELVVLEELDEDVRATGSPAEPSELLRGVAP